MEVLTGHEGCKQLQVEQHTPLFPESHLKAFQLVCSELIAHQTHRVPTRAGWKGLKTPVKCICCTQNIPTTRSLVQS